MTKFPRRNVSDVGIELWASCMPSELASDRATVPDLVVGMCVYVCIYECMSTFSNISSSETTRPIEAKFHV